MPMQSISYGVQRKKMIKDKGRRSQAVSCRQNMQTTCKVECPLFPSLNISRTTIDDHHRHRLDISEASKMETYIASQLRHKIQSHPDIYRSSGDSSQVRSPG